MPVVHSSTSPLRLCESCKEVSTHYGDPFNGRCENCWSEAAETWMWDGCRANAFSVGFMPSRRNRHHGRAREALSELSIRATSRPSRAADDESEWFSMNLSRTISRAMEAAEEAQELRGGTEGSLNGRQRARRGSIPKAVLSALSTNGPMSVRDILHVIPGLDTHFATTVGPRRRYTSIKPSSLLAKGLISQQVDPESGEILGYSITPAGTASLAQK